MAFFDNQMIARAMQKRDKTRVALRKSACGAVLIDGMPFSVSVESDGAANKKGVMLVIAGDAVENGDLTVNMFDVTFPDTMGKPRTIKRKPELYEKKEGGQVLRLWMPEINIPACDDPDSLTGVPRTEEMLMNATAHQMVFRFTPRYSGKDSEVMINIYPHVNPLDGSCTEWVTLTSDKDFFEHGGLAKIMRKKK